MSSGLKSLRNKEESSRGTLTMRGSGILVGKMKFKAGVLGKEGRKMI